jgi:hypothetical protein
MTLRRGGRADNNNKGIQVLARWKDDRFFGNLLGQRASGAWEVLLDDASTIDLPLDHLVDFHENWKACAVDGRHALWMKIV